MSFVPVDRNATGTQSQSGAKVSSPWLLRARRAVLAGGIVGVAVLVAVLAGILGVRFVYDTLGPTVANSVLLIAIGAGVLTAIADWLLPE